MSGSPLRSLLTDQWAARRPASTRRASPAGQPAAPGLAGPHVQLRQELFDRLLLDVESRGFTGVTDARLIRDRVRRVMQDALDQEGFPALSGLERDSLENEVVAQATGLGPLEPLFADATVSDILVNGPDQVFIDRFGRLEKVPVHFDSEAQLLQLMARLVADCDRHIDASSPFVDARLRDGSRLNAVIPPLSPSPVMCIRRSRAIPFTLAHLCAAGTLDPRMAAFLERCVVSGANLVISGGVGTGKTTLLSVLAGSIPADSRIVTIEETAELRLPHPHVVSLESRLPNVEGKGEVTLRMLVRNALRMRADRLIVGEVRGPEVFDMLQAMNTGHQGSLTTVHANSPADALRRLEGLVLLAGFPLPSRAIRELLASTVHMVIQLRRFPDGTRRIVSIDDVTFDDDVLGTAPVFAFENGAFTAKARESRTGCAVDDE